jgi:hypothetical protein
MLHKVNTYKKKLKKCYFDYETRCNIPLTPFKGGFEFQSCSYFSGGGLRDVLQRKTPKKEQNIWAN